MTETMSESQCVPGVPAGPDTDPASFSVVAPQDAGFIGDGPATNVAQCFVASSGGAILRRAGRIDNAPETFAAAFVSVTAGWGVTRNAGGGYGVDGAGGGGDHRAPQTGGSPTPPRLAVPRKNHTPGGAEACVT